jgi:O-antigen/teichoic acid export membrane protein
MLLLVKAEDITILLFTEKWRGSIIFLQVFCVVKLFEPFITVQRELLLSQGKAKLLLKIFIITSVLEMGLILFVIKFGILYVVLATFIGRLIQYITYITINAKSFGANWFEEIKWFKPYILNTAFMVAGVLIIEYSFYYMDISLPLFLKLCVELLAGIGLYAFIALKLKLDEMALITAAWQMAVKKITK